MKWKDWDVNLKVRLIGELMVHMLFWMYFPFMTLHFVDAFGETRAGFLMMVLAAIGIIANLFGGYFADRYGRKRMMAISTLAQSILLFLFAFSPSAWLDFLAFAGITCMGSFYWPASMAMVADVTGPDERRPIFAAFYTAMNVGVVAGPVLGSFFFFEYRFWLLISSALAEFAFFLALMKFLRETLPKSAQDLPAQQGIKEQIRNYRLIFGDPVFLLYILSGILVAKIMMQMDLYMGLYLKNFVPEQTLIALGDWRLAVDGLKLFGWLISENGLLVVLFTMLVAKLSRNASDKLVLVSSSLLFGFSFWLMAFTQNAWLLMGCMFLFTLAELLRTPVAQSFIAKLAPEDKRGQYMGASSLQFSVGRAIAPLTITLAGWLSPFGIFSLLLAEGILSALLYLWMFRKMERDERYRPLEREPDVPVK